MHTDLDLLHRYTATDYFNFMQIFVRVTKIVTID